MKKIRRAKHIKGSFGCALILLALLTGCASSPPRAVYRAHFGTEPSESEVATLDLGEAAEAIIDDMYYVSRTRHDAVKLASGEHRIQWTSTFGVSVLVEPAGYASFGIVSKVRLEAGRTYRLSADRTTGHGYRVYLWIEDTATGQVIHGTKKP